MKKWDFELGDRVQLLETEEEGTVIGRAEYLHEHDNYYVRYKAADGRQLKVWWGEPDMSGVVKEA